MMLAVLFLALLATNSHAATYYVAVTGNDTTGNGSLATPWRNPQKCVMAGTPLVAGDTCVVQAGTYTNVGDGSVPGGFKGRVIVINASSPVATVSNRITIKSEVPLGAIIEAPNVWPGVDCDAAGTSCPFSGIYLSGGGSYYTIDGFQFVRPGNAQGVNGSISGVTALTATTGVIIRNNHFHDLARTVCSNSIFGNVGVYGQNPTGWTVENNTFNTIGRLRSGESGCTTTIFQHDHGVYLEAATDVTIQRNVFYDTNRGFPIVAKARTAGTKTLRLFIYNNTFADQSPTTKPEGQISLTNQHDDTRIKNNIFSNPEGGYFVWASPPPASYATVPVGAGIIIQYNLSDSTNAQTNLVLQQSTFTGITASNNTLNASPGFLNAASRDYRLAAGSAAINAGVDVGLSYSGAAPDCGAFEFGSGVGLLSVPAGRFYMAKSFVLDLFPLAPVNGATGIPVEGGLAVAMQVRCDNGGPCPSQAYRLNYACAACSSGGTVQAVPAVAGADKIELWGVTGELYVLAGQHGANLTGSEPHLDGQTYWDSATTGTYDLLQNSSTVLRWLVRIKTGAPSNAEYCFTVTDSAGVALSSHTPSGGLCVSVGAASANSGP